MLHFTKQERIVLIGLCCVMLCGYSIRYLVWKYPPLENMVDFLNRRDVYPKIDINTASAEELEAIPYIGLYTANNIVEYRRVNGPFTNIEQIKKVKGIKDKNYQKFSQFLEI